MELKSFLLVLLLVFVELLTVSSLKRWSIGGVERGVEGGDRMFLYLGLFGYLVVGGLFAYILHTHSTITVVNSLWQVLNIVLVAALGVWIYEEKLSTFHSIGVFLAIVATIILAN